MNDEISKMQDVLYKYFRDERGIDFIVADRFRAEFGQPTISYSYLRGEKGAVVISIQTPDFEETPIKSCHTAEELENLLQSILYNFIPKPAGDDFSGQVRAVIDETLAAHSPIKRTMTSQGERATIDDTRVGVGDFLEALARFGSIKEVRRHFGSETFSDEDVKNMLRFAKDLTDKFWSVSITAEAGQQQLQ